MRLSSVGIAVLNQIIIFSAWNDLMGMIILFLKIYPYGREYI